MPRPNLRHINYWENLERRVLQVLEIALRLLSSEEVLLSQSEDPINRRLYYHIPMAMRKLHNQGIKIVFTPMYEARNQPATEDREQQAIRERKRPDFQFVYTDHYDPNPSASVKQYVVECKRLGNSGRNDWILNENYINHGVMRFRDIEFGYAKSQPSGAMIGYMQNMTPDSILSEVNNIARRNALPGLCLSQQGWMLRDVSRLEHQFERPVKPSPFMLKHLWLDLTGPGQRQGNQSSIRRRRQPDRPESSS